MNKRKFLSGAAAVVGSVVSIPAFSSILAEDKSSRSEFFNKMIQSGMVTRNEAKEVMRAEEGLGKVDNRVLEYRRTGKFPANGYSFIERNICPLCDSGFRLFYGDLGMEPGLRGVKCNGCGMEAAFIVNGRGGGDDVSWKKLNDILTSS